MSNDVMTAAEAQAMIEEMIKVESTGLVEEIANVDEAVLKPQKLVALATSIIDKAKNIKALLADLSKYASKVDIIIDNTSDIRTMSNTMLFNLGIRESQEESVPGVGLMEAAGKDFWDYFIGAQQSFLNDAAKAIKKLAGGYAESVKVVRSRSSVWLEYKGQDRSDIDLEVVISMVVKEPDVYFYMDVKSVMGGSWKREAHYKIGQALTDNVVNLFQEAFGR